MILHNFRGRVVGCVLIKISPSNILPAILFSERCNQSKQVTLFTVVTMYHLNDTLSHTNVSLPVTPESDCRCTLERHTVKKKSQSLYCLIDFTPRRG